MSPETSQVYVEALADLDPPDVRAAALRCIRTASFFPSVAEIRQEVAEHTLGLPTVGEALGLASQAVGIYRTGIPLVDEAIAAINMREQCMTEGTAGVWRGEFVKVYTDLRAGTLRRWMCGN